MEQQEQKRSLLGWMAHGSLVRYFVVGVLGAAIDYGVFHWVYRALQGSMPITAKALANAAGMVVGGVICYTLNRVWSFHSKGPVLSQASAYATLMVVNIFLSGGLIYALGALTVMSPQRCKVVAMVCIFLWNYCINRFWIFRRRKEPPGAHSNSQ